MSETTVANRFKSAFKPFVCEGDKISACIDGVDFVARVYRDDCADTPDERNEGFWLSQNPQAAGYIGEKTQAEFESAMKQAKKTMAAWRRGDWFYCGIALEAEKNDEPLIEKYAIALWGIECNYPGTNNEYLTQVANDLLEEYFASIKQ